jgi:hypothetical protein
MQSFVSYEQIPPKKPANKHYSGGLGLTGGIVDVGGLYDCLMGIFTGKAGLDILDQYDTIRREKYNTIVNPISSENFQRLWGQDPDKALENDSFLQLCQQATKDKELAVKLLLVSLK